MRHFLNILAIISMLLVGCENPYFANLHSEEGTETYQFDVSAVYLNIDSNDILCCGLKFGL